MPNFTPRLPILRTKALHRQQRQVCVLCLMRYVFFQVDTSVAPIPYGYPSAKAQVLFDLLAARNGRTLVFVEQVCFVLPVAAMLAAHLKEPVKHVSGAQSMLRETRDANVGAFRTGECRILVATAALEEGLDVPDCDCVVRYDSFSNVKSHLQGSGRARQLGSEVFYFDNSPEEEDKRTATMMGAGHLGASTQASTSVEQPGTGEGHEWGPEATIWDMKVNKSFRGQSCAICGANLRITSRAYGQGGKKKERLYSVEGTYVCPGYWCGNGSENAAADSAEQQTSADPAAGYAAVFPAAAGSVQDLIAASEQDSVGTVDAGEGHSWGPEATMWDVNANASYRGHSCVSCSASLRITVRAYGRARKKKERSYALEGAAVCPMAAQTQTAADKSWQTQTAVDSSWQSQTAVDKSWQTQSAVDQSWQTQTAVAESWQTQAVVDNSWQTQTAIDDSWQ